MIAAALLLACLQDEAPTLDQLLKNLDDKEQEVREDSFVAIRASTDPKALERARKTLEGLLDKKIKDAAKERTRALKEAATASRKGLDVAALAAKQRELEGMLERGECKQMRAPVEELWGKFYLDPAKVVEDKKFAEADARVQETVARLAELAAGGAGDKVAAIYASVDEAQVIRMMSPKDQKTMAANAALAPTLDAQDYRQMFLVNQYRVLAGKPALAIDPKLVECCKDHSKDMVERNFFSHESPVGGKRSFRDRAANFKTSAKAENIYRGSEKAEDAFWSWFESDDHHRNMMGGHTRIGTGRNGPRWTQMFGG